MFRDIYLPSLFDIPATDRVSKDGEALIVEVPAMRASREDCAVEFDGRLLTAKTKNLGEKAVHTYSVASGYEVVSAKLDLGVLTIRLESTVKKQKIEIS